MLLNIILIFYILVSKVEQIDSLVELRYAGHDVLNTEAIIRNITNNLFTTLKLTKIKDKPKLRQYSMVHKNLVSMVQQEYNNLYEIFKITRVATDNATNNFMPQLNALLNNDNKIENIESIDLNEQSVLTNIEEFLARLKELKEIYGVNKAYNESNNNLMNSLDNANNYINEPREHDWTLNNKTSLDENEFWVPDYSSRRIFRGIRTKIKYFPFMAVILFFGKFQCAGSIIKSDLVITASSCLQLAWNNRLYRENPAFISVRVGSNFYNGGGEVIPVIQVYFHPSYNPKTLEHNLCILRLGRKLKFRKHSKRIKKIDFDRNDNILPETTAGVTVVGWGAKSKSNVLDDPWRNKISYAVLDFYGLRECQDIYSKEYVTRQHFCAGFISKGGGACNRDVGGPGIVRGILMGVISFGSPVCGATDAPTVFTKIGFYADWIEEIMEQDVPTINQRTTLKYTFNFLEDIPTTERTTTFKIQPLSSDRMAKISIFDSEQPTNSHYLKTLFNYEIDSLKDPGRENGQKLETQFETDNLVSATAVIPSNSKHIASLSSTGKIEPVTSTPKDSTDFDVKMTKIFASAEEKNSDLEETKQNVKEAKQDKSQITNTSENNEISGDDIVKILNTIDMKEDDTVTSEIKNHKVDELQKQMSIIKDDADKSILTLLYLSDSEKKDNKLKLNVENEAVEGGLSIPVELTTDVTHRNNEADTREDFYDILSKAELYDILNEAILSEVSANKTKRKK